MSRNRSLLSLSAIIVCAALFSTPAWAHVGVSSPSGLMNGFLHPLTGLDHILAMLAVGMFAAKLGGKALWLVPLSFISFMVLGGSLAIEGIAVPFVETGIAI